MNIVSIIGNKWKLLLLNTLHVYVNSSKQNLLFINKELHQLYTIISENGFERNSFDVWPCGAMVAREIPDLKVGGSNPSFLKKLCFFIFFQSYVCGTSPSIKEFNS